METTKTLSPRYDEILKEIGRQLRQRRSDVLRRTHLITWPLITVFVAGYLFNEVYIFDTLTEQKQLFLGGVATVLFLMALFYSVIVGFIFEIEKHVWVDSYFDKKNLTLPESWKIAKRLWLPALKFRFRIFLKYWFLPSLGFLLCLIGLLWISNELFAANDEFNNIKRIIFISLSGLIVFTILYTLYAYYMRVKLRYSWFLFLDNYGNNNSKDLISEMNELNQISRSDTFKKSLIANLGTDSVRQLTSITIGVITSQISQFGRAGRVAGGVINFYGNEANKQFASLGNITAQYILYRFARKELYNEEQVVNTHLYEL